MSAAAKQLSAAHPRSKPLRRSWCVVQVRGKPLSPVAQAFVDYLRSQRSLINALGIALEPAAGAGPGVRPAAD